MDPHIDDELKEYLRLIDATVKSASVNHISPEKGAFASFPQQLKANELFQNGIKLINNFDEKEQKSCHYPKRKKPEILDDSIDWNIGSQQTTLESPKSQDDIKDLCLGIQSLQCGNNSQNQQNQQSQFFSSFNCISASSQFFQKLQRFFPEQQPGDQLNLSCLCSLDTSSKPSRNMVIQLSQQDDLEQFLGFIRTYGDIQNIDHHKYQLEKIVVLSFYNIQSSLSAFQSLSQSYANKMKVSYLSDFNDFDYIDYMLISNANSFNQKLVLDYLGCFGKILEYSSLNSKLVVRYFDVRSLKEVDRIIKLQEKDRKSFIYLHRAHFPEVEEKFIQELLKNILIFSKENTTDIILKNARVKSVKQNAPLIQQQQQQPIQTKQNEGISSQQLGLMPTSPNNTSSSPAIPSGLELGYNQRLNSYSFFNSNNTLNPIQQQTINNIFNNYYNIDENTNNSFQVIQPNKQDNLYQQTYSAQNQNQQPQLYAYQQRRELQEISDYQNTLIAQKTLSQNNKFLSSNSSNSLSAQIDNQSYINNENENIYTCKQLQQKKQKKMNPNVNNFSSFNYNSNGSNSNNDNTNNNNGSSLKLLQNSFSGNILQASCHHQPQLKQNNSQMNMNQLQQSISNLQMSQEIGSSQQQIQYLQQISQSSSSSLSSTNFPQYNQGGYFSNNFNQLRKSQEENPFSASSLRMSFDNNQIYQINNSFYQSNNNNNNNNSQTNTNPMNNSQNLNNQMITNQNNAVTGQLQVRLQNSQQTQFMNLLNNNNQFLNEMCFNNPQNPNMVEQYEATQMQNNLNGQASNRQYPNQINLHNNYQPSQSQSKVSTILGSNGTKQNNNLNFQVILENISSFKDRRATIMVRNIPNRYNQEDFLRIIDINYKGLYDFVYLPMDFKNHCNIGYAFINFIDPKHIIPFYNEFNGKRWEMIRSEKVCYICYARIQGRNELIAHFKKSGVMSALVDKSFKPLILPNPTLDLQILQQ